MNCFFTISYCGRYHFSIMMNDVELISRICNMFSCFCVSSENIDINRCDSDISIMRLDRGYKIIFRFHQFYVNNADEVLFILYECFEAQIGEKLFSDCIMFHGASLSRGDDAICLLAKTGGGKSTLAAYLGLNGWNYLSDDITAVDTNHTVLPIPLPLSMGDALIKNFRTHLLLEKQISMSKNLISIPHLRCAKSFPKIKSFIFLDRSVSGGCSLQKLRTGCGYSLLMQHLKYSEQIETGRTMCRSLVKSTRIYKLMYCDFKSAANQLYELYKRGYCYDDKNETKNS